MAKLRHTHLNKMHKLQREMSDVFMKGDLSTGDTPRYWRVNNCNTYLQAAIWAYIGMRQEQIEEMLARDLQKVRS